ncbi:MAG: hypothetical protein HZB26_03505 [Candidatus Hydrogenedentes bacterium]|nr:hypothetical protein [Candidatus Hydrogenedentota bacterium]
MAFRAAEEQAKSTGRRHHDVLCFGRSGDAASRRVYYWDPLLNLLPRLQWQTGVFDDLS